MTLSIRLELDQRNKALESLRTDIGGQKDDIKIGVTCENAESYVNHEGGEIDCALVQNTATEYDPPPTYR